MKFEVIMNWNLKSGPHPNKKKRKKIRKETAGDIAMKLLHQPDWSWSITRALALASLIFFLTGVGQLPISVTYWIECWMKRVGTFPLSFSFVFPTEPPQRVVRYWPCNDIHSGSANDGLCASSCGGHLWQAQRTNEQRLHIPRFT